MSRPNGGGVKESSQQSSVASMTWQERESLHGYKKRCPSIVNMRDRIRQAMEKENQKVFLQKLIGVIGVQESEVGGYGDI
jgi:hypothetical protein